LDEKYEAPLRAEKPSWKGIIASMTRGCKGVLAWASRLILSQ
jgi:hypothetical protein